MDNIIKLPAAIEAATTEERPLTLAERIRRDYQLRLQSRRNAAETVQQDAETLSIPPVEPVDGGGYYDGWKGSHAGTWHDSKELKALLMADFKKAGIKASVRFHRGGYLTSLTVTVKLAADDVKSFEAWAETWKPIASGWMYYTDEDGKLREIFAERFYGMSTAEQMELLPNLRRTQYDLEVKRLTSSGNCHSGKIDVLTDKANGMFQTVQAIVTSYNRDQSNTMIDYFDRDIYDNYAFKIV